MKNKKINISVIAVAAFAASSAAMAQSSITLYGMLDAGIGYTSNINGHSRYGLDGGASGSNKWGLRGQEDLGGGLQAVFKIENGFNIGTGGIGGQGPIGNTRSLFNRQAYVGLASNQYGALRMGRQLDAVTEMVQVLTGDAISASTFSTPGDVDNNDNSLRVSNAIKYTSPVWAGLQVEAMYALGGVAGATGKGQTWAAAAAYNNGPVGLAAGYFHANNSAPLSAAGVRTGWAGTSDAIFDGSGSFINNAYSSASSIGIAQVAGQYAFGPVTVGAGYSNAQYKADANSGFGTNQKYNTGRAFVTYQASAPLLLGLGYIYTKGSGQTDAKYHQVSLGADYSLSKRTDVYLVGAYQHASGHNADGTDAQASIGSYGIAGKSSQEIVALGLRHKF